MSRSSFGVRSRAVESFVRPSGVSMLMKRLEKGLESGILLRLCTKRRHQRA